MKLAEHLELLALDVAFWLSGIKSPDYPLEALGDISLEVCEKLRAIAIIQLLVQSEIDLFYHNLIRSGVVWSEYLHRCQVEQRRNEHHHVSGRLAPLFDAIASGDMSLSARIADLCPKEWRRGHEYEDDYCYAQILHRWLRTPPAEEEIPPLLDQLAAYLDGESNARLSVSRALLVRDQRAFDEGFDMLLGEVDARIVADKARGQLEEAPVVAQRQIFIEGLALLRIAEARGIETKVDYPFCPSLARVSMRTPFPGQ